MEIEEFGARVRRLRQERGLGQRLVAARVGRSKTWLIHLETGQRWKGELPPLGDLRKLAAALEMSVAQLIGTDLDGDEVEEHKAEESAPNRPRYTKEELLERIGAYPVYDASIELDQTVSAGKGKRAGIPQGLEAIEEIETVPLPDGKLLYALRVTGRCMEPEIMPGWTVRLDKDQEPVDGDIVVAVQDGEKALVKWLDRSQTLQYLLPLNGDPILIDESIEIVGVVRDIVKPTPPKPRRRPAPKVPKGQSRLPE